ncbi:MAG: LacI family DNA-binding transcriptional regulator [Pseudomonadota bacterium]
MSTKPQQERSLGTPEVSIRKVAELAGVSIATVSRCLNEPDRVREKTRLKVQEAIVATGYAPNTLARNFRRGRTNLIMVVLPSVGDPFFTGVLEGIRRVVTQRGYTLIISETSASTLSADEMGAMLVSRQADGFILLASNFPFGEGAGPVPSRGAQPIVIGCETMSASLSDVPSVHIDNVQAAHDATDYLLAQGHRRIAFMTGQVDSRLTRDRERGYRQAMEAASQSVAADWVVEGGLSLEGAARATRLLLEHPLRPTAIFCANDEMAMGCLQALKAARIEVPAAISVMGFDDIRYAAVCNPALTTVAQPTELIGERVAQRMLDAIDGHAGEGSGSEVVPHRLVIRESVSKPPSGD